jgi:iron(III) transport system substrate-binding protein
MSHAKRIGTFFFISAMVALLVSPCLAAGVPSYYPKDYSKIIEASRAEKGLYIYQNTQLENWKGALAIFNKLYPWINVKMLDLGGAEVLPRYIAESETGALTADLLVTKSPRDGRDS